ncbi:hypothetical protein [Nannocystis pusilla]|uniref:Uncharacterized protein n=1 Tax=Nannocystis pusilla TaxID=889268 RepID=A0ABS7TPN4_9BACT|nr:hypothetical protein [Nannocystis pusilla]MBZ5710102.1 hypothetical protein [Nannocystis pusilla]
MPTHADQPPQLRPPGASQRMSEAAALERWIEHGPRPLPRRRESVWTWSVPLAAIAATVGLLVFVPDARSFAPLWILAVGLAIRHYLRVRSIARHQRALEALSAEVARLPFPVREFHGWLGPRGGRLGPLVIRLRGALPRAERAVLVAEPTAHVEWPASEWMIVTVEWRNTTTDLRRVRRVLVEMLPLVHAVRRVVDVECQRQAARPA